MRQDEEHITFEDLLYHLTGEDEDGDPKSVMYAGILEVSTDDAVEEHTGFTAVPEVSIDRISVTGKFVMVQINFHYEANIWLQRFMELLDEFYQIIDKSKMFLLMEITNLLGDTNYHLTLLNPVCYARGMDSMQNPVIVQVVFDTDTIFAVQDNFDIEDIRAELLREDDDELYLQMVKNENKFTKEVLNGIDNTDSVIQGLSSIRNTTKDPTKDDKIRFTGEE